MSPTNLIAKFKQLQAARDITRTGSREHISNSKNGRNAATKLVPEKLIPLAEKRIKILEESLKSAGPSTRNEILTEMEKWRELISKSNLAQKIKETQVTQNFTTNIEQEIELGRITIHTAKQRCNNERRELFIKTIELEGEKQEIAKKRLGILNEFFKKLERIEKIQEGFVNRQRATIDAIKTKYKTKKLSAKEAAEICLHHERMIFHDASKSKNLYRKIMLTRGAKLWGRSRKAFQQI